ncbi:MAG TPA: hypothetical protein VGP58_09990 [Pyrinomonadaceae bacterium]|jgi:hypothetical protein|nr:hypothetical protein [Pyrinomonadaceae bacterium]
MNQSMNTSLDGEQLANDIWAMFGTATRAVPDNHTAAPGNQTNGAEQNEIGDIPDLATEILSKLEQKKETAATHLGISAAEVETMPFDLTALEQAGIFLNIDATGFSVLSRQLDWQSLGIELPKEQTVHLSPPRTGLLPDDYRKPLQRAASRAHNALDRYSFRFALCETVLGSSEYRWIPYTAFEAFEKEFAAALENLARAKSAVIDNYPEILETLRETFRQLATDSAERLAATVKDEPFDRDEFINRTVGRALAMTPTIAMIRDGMRIDMRPKVILLGSEMRAEQTRAAKLDLETQITKRAQKEIAIEIEAQKDIAEIKVKTAYEDEKREQELKERIRQIKIEAVKKEMEASISPLKEGLDQLNSTIYEAAKEMAEKLNNSKFVAGGTAKRAREMYRWFKLMNFTQDAEVETVLAELNKIASTEAKQRTAAEMKEAVDAVIIATSKRARKLLKTEQLDALEL